MRIGIIGIGAMGCLFAARLDAVAEIVMLGHWPEQIETLRGQGLTYQAPDGQRRQIRVRVTDRPADARPVQAALVLVKSYQTATAAATAAQILERDGIAVTLQNGLGNLETIAAAVGRTRAVPGATTEGATLVRPGLVRHAGTGATFLGCPPGVNEALVRDTAALFIRAGLRTQVREGVDGVVWRKLIVNAAINPLTAILDVRNGFLAEVPTAREILLAVAREAAQVARAHGVDVGGGEPGAMALEVARQTAQNSSSMRQDVQSGRPTEVEAINGSITRLGQEHGVQTPLNQVLAELLTLRQQGATWQTLLNTIGQTDAAPEFALLRQLLQEVSDASLQKC